MCSLVSHEVIKKYFYSGKVMQKFTSLYLPTKLLFLVFCDQIYFSTFKRLFCACPFLSPFYGNNFRKYFCKRDTYHPLLCSEREWLEQIYVFPEVDTTLPIYLFSIAFSLLQIHVLPALTHSLNNLKFDSPAFCSFISKPFLPQRLT